MGIFPRLWFNLSYLGRPPWDSGVTPPELLAFIESHPPAKALDLGCGTGTNAIALARYGWEVVGVDFARQAIYAARRKARQAGVKVDFRVEDVTQLRGLIDASFGLILDIGCFHSLNRSDRQGYLRNVERLLAPGGAFLLYTFVQQDERTQPGVTEIELAQMAQRWPLEWRQDGDFRGRPSAWLLFRGQS